MPVIVLPQPTTSILVPVNLGDQPYGILMVQFRTKHSGGVGLPGERMDVTKDSIRGASERGAKEELGLNIPAADFKLFCVRDKPGRDIRKGVLLSKLAHERPLPEALQGVPREAVHTSHGPDNVCFTQAVDLDGLGVKVPLWDEDDLPADAPVLTPGDPEEVRRIVLVDVRQPLPTLPISDDAQLLLAWKRFVDDGMREIPGILD